MIPINLALSALSSGARAKALARSQMDRNASGEHLMELSAYYPLALWRFHLDDTALRDRGNMHFMPPQNGNPKHRPRSSLRA